MSEEQKSIDKPTSTNPDGNNDRKRGRFMGIIIAAVVLIAVLIGVGIYNTPANRIGRHLDLGARYLEEQDYEQAIVEFDQVIAIDPMSVDAYLGKAQAYEGMGDTEKAIETLAAGYEKTGDKQLKAQLVDTYLKQAVGYVQAADYDSALAVYDKLLELDGENERVQEAVGDCLTDYIEQLIVEERYDEAKVLIKKYRDKVSGVDFQAYLDEIEKLMSVNILLENSYDMEGLQLEEAKELLVLINEWRVEDGLAELTWNSVLEKEAQISATTYAESEGRISGGGPSSTGQMECSGYKNAEEVVNFYKNSVPDFFTSAYYNYTSMGGALYYLSDINTPQYYWSIFYN